MDTQRQNFWKESIDKEAQVRLDWHVRFSKEFANKSAPARPRKQTQALIPVPNLAATTTNRFNKVVPTTISSPSKQTEAAASESLVEMRPASAKTKALLYKGFSALGEGRHLYLKHRNQQKPEAKYEYPMTSTWEYGWKIGEVAKMKPSEFGRTRIVKDSFYRHNGVFGH